jgi:enamine deaminase RidA (YjgF/YER057c/UK114 family)
MAGEIRARMAELGLELPAMFAAPPGVKLSFDAVRFSGSHAYVSGHGPLDGTSVLMEGKVGAAVSVEQGYQAARLTALSMLATLDHELGDLDRVVSWVKALGFVNCAPGFNATPAVVNGFSDLIGEVWGDAGRHARSAVGVAELPFDMPVEVEAIIEVR